MNGWRIALLAGVVLLGAGSVQAGSSNSLMDLSADGTLLAFTNRDSGSVTVFGLRPAIRAIMSSTSRSETRKS